MDKASREEIKDLRDKVKSLECQYKCLVITHKAGKHLLQHKNKQLLDSLELNKKIMKQWDKTVADYKRCVRFIFYSSGLFFVISLYWLWKLANP